MQKDDGTMQKIAVSPEEAEWAKTVNTGRKKDPERLVI